MTFNKQRYTDIILTKSFDHDKDRGIVDDCRMNALLCSLS